MTSVTPELRHGTVALDGVTIAYREAGAPGGLPVMLLHALGSDAGTWERFAIRLAGRGRHVLAPDLRGHGGSTWTGTYSMELMRDDVIGFLDACGIGHVDLVGHSMGGAVAVLVAQRQPERVRRLVVEDTPPPPREPVSVEAAPVAEPSEPLPFDWRSLEPIITEFRTPRPDWWERLRTISARTLLVSGGPTSHVSLDALTRMNQIIADCRLVTVPDAGHRVHSQRPEEFWRVTSAFLDDHPGAPDS
ncbi:alpha/beta fold hydrolase [Nonomuraea sp. NPDC050783]|uniref:alpha/beta fold hydrolase n=1 Tax=Nonomuraea sp. NPDC050783 TaxID=3154634 RepID=UPI003467750E